MNCAMLAATESADNPSMPFCTDHSTQESQYLAGKVWREKNYVVVLIVSTVNIFLQGTTLAVNLPHSAEVRCLG